MVYVSYVIYPFSYTDDMSSRTVTVKVTPRPAPPTEARAVPRRWVVHVDGQEFVHGHVHALPFDLAEDAAQFIADLRDEYPPDIRFQVIGLDDLGLPLPPPSLPDPAMPWPDDEIPPALPTPTERDRIQAQVARALFQGGPAEHRRDVIVGLYRHLLPPRHLAQLARLDPAYVIARLKAELPGPVLERAEYEVWLSALRQLQAGNADT